FAAFLGLTPREHSTGGKPRLGRITKMGDRYLRKLLVVGACSALAARKGHNDALRRWASGLLRGGARQQAGADRLCARDQRRPLRRPSGRRLNQQAQQERGFAALRSASRATAKRCEPTERLGSPAKGRRHRERVLLIGRRAMRTNIRASGTFVPAPTGRRHDRTRSVRKASTKPLTTGRRPDMPEMGLEKVFFSVRPIVLSLALSTICSSTTFSS